MTGIAFALAERFELPVILRLTTRVCHSKTIVEERDVSQPSLPVIYRRDVRTRVMIPAFARTAHRRLREKLAEIAVWNEASDLNPVFDGDRRLGIIASGVAFMHAREAAPNARFLKIGCSHPYPMDTIRAFAAGVDRCVVIEEGDPVAADAIRAAGIDIESKPEMYRFGELNVTRVARILAGDVSPEEIPVKGKPPRLCPGCPHRTSFELLRDLECIVTGDIGCCTLGVLPPFDAMDTCVCMGAAIGVGLGMRHVLPADQARRVVSVIIARRPCILAAKKLRQHDNAASEACGCAVCGA